jgi:hypothetical protein
VEHGDRRQVHAFVMIAHTAAPVDAPLAAGATTIGSIGCDRCHRF